MQKFAQSTPKPTVEQFAILIGGINAARKRHALLAITLVLVACGGAAPVLPLPTAHVVRHEAVVSAITIPSVTPFPQNIATQAPTATIAQLLAAPLDQYRAWMEQARAAHPYRESVDVMWEVMLCESSGQSEVVASGSHYGLFQYTLDTWSADWNPYRSDPILDPRAQILATAKAWQDGNQHWWGCYQ